MQSVCRQSFAVGLLAVTILVACAPAAPAPAREVASGSGAPAAGETGRKKVLNMAVTTIIDAFSLAGSSTTSGGGLDYIEIHSQALFTADKTTGRPIPRLLAELPTLDNSGLRIAEDGRMIATYKLRRDVGWADGVPLTAKDLMFSYRVVQNRSMPVIDRGPALLMDSAAAPDDHTFVITWKQPYYMADAIGLRPFWPLPAHLLESDFATLVEERQDSQTFLAKPYWTSEYVHVGPFKLTEFRHGVEAAFDAVDQYFLGRPRVDRIVVKQFGDQNTAFANILSGAVDLSTGGGLSVEGAVELKPRWDTDGGGKIYFGTGTTGFVSVQFDRNVPSYQTSLQDVRVRQALYHATDREAYAEVATAGIPDKAAYALLPPDNPLYSYVRDAWKQRYPYDPTRAVAAFEAAGWRRGADGMLVNAAGERLRIDIWDTPGGEDTAAVMTDMWKRVGVDTSMAIVPAAGVRDAEFRQQFPAVELTARGSQDSILTRLECAEQPSPQNRFSGNNRGHWCTPEYERLVTQYRTNLREEGRGQTIKQIQDLLLEELPLMLLHYRVSIVFARKGVTAFQDDFAGGSEAGRIYGTYSRNAHEWDIVS